MKNTVDFGWTGSSDFSPQRQNICGILIGITRIAIPWRFKRTNRLMSEGNNNNNNNIYLTAIGFSPGGSRF